MLKLILNLGSELTKPEQRKVNGGRGLSACCNPTTHCCDPCSNPGCYAYGDPNAFPVPYCI